MAGRDCCCMNHEIGRLKARVVAVNVTTPMAAHLITKQAIQSHRLLLVGNFIVHLAGVIQPISRLVRRTASAP
jgi:hypothetical protein